MIKERHWLDKLLPAPEEHDGNRSGVFRGYKNFSRGLTIILLILVLVPMTLISVLSHYQYRRLLRDEEMAQLVLNLEEAQKTIEASVSELQSVIQFIARNDRYEERLDPKELEALFTHLQQEYPGFADIEIIDSEGYQKAYYGPYTLESHRYTEQTWYKEVLQHGVYISNIFPGFRHSPHFVIAVSRKHPDSLKQWVLRVTIEAKTLQKFIDSSRTNYADDMFLIDQDFVTQTQPQKFGNLGEKSILLKTENERELIVEDPLENEGNLSERASKMKIMQKTFNGQKLNHAAVALEKTPWTLVLVKEQYLYANTWTLFKIKLTAMFFSCVIVSVFAILEISTLITNHLRVADKKRQQLYSEAEQSNKLASIGRLAAGVAHEINNPLSIINQKTGLVQDFMEMTDDFEYKEMMREAHESIQKSVNRCKTITHRLLGFARVTDVQTEEFDVNVTVREVVDFLAKEAMYNQIKIDFDLAPDISKITSDRGPLQQILINITNNAIDAIGHDGKITLASRQIDDNTVQVKIIDNGPGMPESIRKRIFEPFFTTKETGKGTGLGLSITYGLVKKLGGEINVISEAGKGTTFEISLPVQQSK